MPSICGVQFIGRVAFLFKRLCVIISRAGVSFPPMCFEFTQMFVSSMQLLISYIFNCTHSVPDTLHDRHCCITIFTHQVFPFFRGVQRRLRHCCGMLHWNSVLCTRAQHMLVDYLSSNYCDEVANWCLDFWRGTGEECLFAKAGIQDAITTWVLKSSSVTSRSSACVLLPLGSSLDANASSSRQHLERSTCIGLATRMPATQMHSFATLLLRGKCGMECRQCIPRHSVCVSW